jgi:hypothetical protein
MTVLPADLRTLMEHEFLGKLLQLRRGYVALPRSARRSPSSAPRASPTIVLLQRALLALLGRPVPQGIEAGGSGGVHRRWERIPRPKLEFVRHRATRNGWRHGNSSNRTWRPWKRLRDL